MPQPLITPRSAVGGYVSDLLWPAVTSSLLIRLEPGEIIRWRGAAGVAEGRIPQGGARQELVWRLAGPADCVITDRRVTYRGRRITVGSSGVADAAVDLRGQPACGPGTILAGQVRFQWVGSVTLKSDARSEVPRCYLTLITQDDDIAVLLTLGLSGEGPVPAGEHVSADLARGLVSDIARFRLATRAATLTPDATRELFRQRYHPSAAHPGPCVWRLPGGLKAGRPPEVAAYRKQLRTRRDRAVALLERYEARRRPRDLETALALARELVEDSAVWPAEALGYRNFYAAALKARYERDGDLADLSAVIDIMRDVVEGTRRLQPGRLSAGLSNLGNTLRDRWERSLDDRDLAEAIAILEEAVTAAGEDPDDWALAAGSLSQAIRNRFPVDGNRADLDRAIGLGEMIQQRLPAAHPERHQYLAALGHALLDRHQALGQPADLDQAIAAYRTSLRKHHSALNRTRLQAALAEATARQADSGPGSLNSRNAAVRAWRTACQEAGSQSPSAALNAARAWSRAALGWGDWPAVTEACGAGLAAADRLFHAQVSVENKTLWLEAAGGLAAQSAYAHAKLGQLERAVVTLEHGRAVLMSESLRRDELEQTTAAIRRAPGYGSVPARPGMDGIAAASRRSPLAYVSYTDAGGMALLVGGSAGSSPAPTVVWLDRLTEAAAMEAARDYSYATAYRLSSDPGRRAWEKTLDKVTRWLWDSAMGPLLSALGGDRVTLLPGGALGLLPMHAAWRPDPSMPAGRRYALDDALITYAPSAEALLGRAEVPADADSILAVFDPDLPNSRPEVETGLRWFTRTRCLGRNQTPLDALRAALPGNAVLHFSCHGSGDLEHPLASRLLAASDGDLTLDGILAQRLPGTRLAVLSACETSVPGMRVPDEATGLPSGLMQAGVQGVIGSLWAVYDTDTRALITRFYQNWKADGAQPAEALRRAQQQVRDTPAMPACPGQLPRAHPGRWAAFQYFGT